MENRRRAFRVFAKKKSTLFYYLLISLFWLAGGLNSFASALELDSYPLFDISRDSFAVHFFREERPSFYWVNIGVPDAFFAGVSQIFSSPIVYSVRSIEFGVRVDHWLTDQCQVRLTIPFESNALEDSTTGMTHSLEKFGDLELG